MPSEDIVTQLRLLGQQAYVAGLRAAVTQVHELEGYQTRLAATSRALGERMDRLSDSAWRLGGRMAAAAAATAGGAVKIGLQFDAMIERSEIGIESLVGSAKRAKSITKEVRQFALQAPLFGVEQMIKTSQQLIGAGYDSKNIVPYLRTFSDTLSALGRKPEDLQRMTYAFVQMMSKGQISAEELRGQLGEIFPAQKILAREMGLTTDEFAKQMKKGSFKGKESIMLLLRGMERDFGGATEKMSHTFDGQMANIRESAKYSLGVLFMPLFEHLEDDVFPQIAFFGDHWTAMLEKNNLTTKEKWQKTKDYANAWLKPIFTDIGKWIDEMDLGQMVADGLEAALPFIANAMGKAGGQASEAFVKGWWKADTWGKIFLGAVALQKIVGFSRIFGGLGRAGGKIFQKAFKKRAAGGIAGGIADAVTGGGEKAGVVNITAGVVNVYGGAGLPGKGKPKPKGPVGKAAGWLKKLGVGAAGAAGAAARSPIARFGATRVALPVAAATTAAWLVKKNLESIKEEAKRTRGMTSEDIRREASEVAKSFRPLGGPLSEPRRQPKLAPGQPNFPSYGNWQWNKPIEITVKNILDGREVSKSVAKHNWNQAARR